MSQASRFAELFVEVKVKHLGLISNSQNGRVLHRPPFKQILAAKKQSKYLKFQAVSEGNTVLYRAALKSKPTASDREFCTLFAELLLNFPIFQSSKFSPDTDLFEPSTIARSITEINQDTQNAALTNRAARGNNAIRKDHHRVQTKRRASEAQRVQT